MEILIRYRTNIWRPLSIVLVCAGLLAQQQTQPPAQQPAQSTADSGAKFETTAQLVVEDVSVIDKNGKPIEGLTAKDFTITEDGVPQTIKFCEPQKLLDTATPPPASATSGQAARFRPGQSGSGSRKGAG